MFKYAIYIYYIFKIFLTSEKITKFLTLFLLEYIIVCDVLVRYIILRDMSVGYIIVTVYVRNVTER